MLKPNGLLLAAAISRFASLLDGLTEIEERLFQDKAFCEIVREDLETGIHLNPQNHPLYFTTAYFHRPEDLAAEISQAGFKLQDIFGIEGPSWMLPDFDKHWNSAESRALILEMAQRVEKEPSLLGMSAHLLAVARKTI